MIFLNVAQRLIKMRFFIKAIYYNIFISNYSSFFLNYYYNERLFLAFLSVLLIINYLHMFKCFNLSGDSVIYFFLLAI